jgi:hypothetical protein
VLALKATDLLLTLLIKARVQIGAGSSLGFLCCCSRFSCFWL